MSSSSSSSSSPRTPFAAALKGIEWWLRHQPAQLIVVGPRAARAAFFDALVPVLVATDNEVRRITDRADAVVADIVTAVVVDASSMPATFSRWFFDEGHRGKTIVDVGFELSPADLDNSHVHALALGVEAATIEAGVEQALTLVAGGIDALRFQVVAHVDADSVAFFRIEDGALPFLAPTFALQVGWDTAVVVGGILKFSSQPKAAAAADDDSGEGEPVKPAKKKRQKKTATTM